MLLKLLFVRLEEELDSMENTNTELKNMINTLNNEREALLEQVIVSRPRGIPAKVWNFEI